ncbi:MAG: hypothetical protein CVV25_12310 [Ignavibacteriae bacterium HGW-Ignavibacteriae-4]|nr:MAG: hypothetical protein CVV25_12310 [Ignavibacteriae bacterium HGW-Ignavibacteriae-4]
MDESPIIACGKTTIYDVNISLGSNLSNIKDTENFESFSVQKYQFTLSYLHDLNNDFNQFLEFGLGYSGKGSILKPLNSIEFRMSLNYITSRIVYHHTIINIEPSTYSPIIVIGGLYTNYLISDNLDDLFPNNSNSLPNYDFGILLGLRFGTYISNGLVLFAEYNYQHGFSKLEDPFPKSHNISHSFNIGLMFVLLRNYY